MGHGDLEVSIRKELSIANFMHKFTFIGGYFMHNFKITCDNGAITIIRARNRETAMMLYCKAEGCSTEWFCEHCKIIKRSEV